MRCTVATSDLVGTLNVLRRDKAARLYSYPVSLDVAKGQACLRGGGGVTAVILPAVDVEEGRVVVEWQLLRGVLALDSLKNPTCSLVLEDAVCILSFEHGQLRLPVVPVKEWYPDLPDLGECLARTAISGDLLTQVCRALVPYAAAQNYPVPSYRGVLFSWEGGALTLWATDGFRLSRLLVPLQQGERLDSPLVVNIPASGLVLANRYFPHGKSISLAIYREDSVLQWNNVVLTLPSLPKPSIDYQSLVAVDMPQRWSVKRRDLSQAVEILAPLLPLDTPLRLVADSAGLRLSGITTTTFGSYTIPYTRLRDKSSKIAFNTKYLQTMLASWDCEQVVIQTKNETSPAQFLPDGDENRCVVIMPVYIAWP